MKSREIEELMALRGWSRTQLAAALDITENTVHQWLSGRRKPRGPTVILMRMWLEESRAKKMEARGAAV